ncbi:U6 snRNA phosphodiesterase 1 [Culicoides brevitarsis]|uniref:U6 snRNA phosphodiesterase 1 n=1 Tax=Culicoides brevitarsis TaxID=469753 RepID=UPI00307B4932
MKNLVQYSSSSDDESSSEPETTEINKNQSPPTKKRKLPVPSFLTTKTPKTDDPPDNPNEHQGRQRSIKHERGIWATFLYIPVPAFDFFEETQQQIIKFLEKSSRKLKIEIIEDLHVSVTKLLILKHHWIESFIDTISEKIRDLPRFKINFSEIEVYCNEEKTRTFIGIKIIDVVQLLKVTEALDECLTEFKLPKYYEDPSFHVSILWCLGDQKEFFEQKKAELQQIFDKSMAESTFQASVNELLCKCGNRSYKFPLR